MSLGRKFRASLNVMSRESRILLSFIRALSTLQVGPVAPCFRGSGVISVFSILYFLCILLAGTGPPPVMVHANICSHTAACVPAFYYVFVLILLYTCPHTTIYLSSQCARTLIYVSAYYYIYLFVCATIYLRAGTGPPPVMVLAHFVFLCVGILVY